MCTEAGQRNTLQQFPLPENKTRNGHITTFSIYSLYNFLSCLRHNDFTVSAQITLVVVKSNSCESLLLTDNFMFL